MPGQTSAQIEARFATDVLAYNPATVNVTAGTNDATNPSFSSTDLACTISNIKSMIDQLRSAGVQPVLCTWISTPYWLIQLPVSPGRATI